MCAYVIITGRGKGGGGGAAPRPCRVAPAGYAQARAIVGRASRGGGRPHVLVRRGEFHEMLAFS